MGLTSLQVCMDSSDWLQGTLQEDESGMDSSPSPLSPNDMLACSRPLNMERRLRPPHDQALKCPRCESTHTKFCYYNNYSLSQPRYFCKTCRRYWTKGGTLRNIPVGGGCRKTKKTPSKAKQNDNASPVSAAAGAGQSHAVGGGSSSSNTTDLQLSFPDQVQFAHLSGLIGPHHHQHHHHHHNNFLPIDFMESKLEGIVGNNSHRNGNDFDFMGNSASGGGDLGMVNLGNGTTNHGLLMEHNFHANICAPFGMSLLEGGQCGPGANSNGVFIDTCQRMMLPYEASGSGGGAGGHEGRGGIDVKPNTKALLSLDWQQEQGCSSDHHVGKDSFGYLNGLGNWSGVMNNYGPSTTNSLV